MIKTLPLKNILKFKFFNAHDFTRFKQTLGDSGLGPLTLSGSIRQQRSPDVIDPGTRVRSKSSCKRRGRTTRFDQPAENLEKYGRHRGGAPPYLGRVFFTGWAIRGRSVRCEAAAAAAEQVCRRRVITVFYYYCCCCCTYCGRWEAAAAAGLRRARPRHLGRRGIMKKTQITMRRENPLCGCGGPADRDTVQPTDRVDLGRAPPAGRLPPNVMLSQHTAAAARTPTCTLL